MSDLDHEARELIERLRKLGQQQATGDDFHEGRLLTAKDTMYWVAADAITAALSRAHKAEAEVARLREALRDIDQLWIANKSEGDEWEDGYDDGLRQCHVIARAALEGDDK